jgi:hypothetical protein
MIQVCMDFHDLKKSCLEGNFPTPFINQILNECKGSDIFSLMDGFSGYNHIQIRPEDQCKTIFIFPLETFAYKNMPFGLKNIGATFQWAMMFSFHDLKNTVEDYLDDLTTHLCKRKQHLLHLSLNFERCCQYQIHLNPQKCIFCVTSRRLLGFIVSTKGIMVDPLKVEAITHLILDRVLKWIGQDLLEGRP